MAAMSQKAAFLKLSKNHNQSFALSSFVPPLLCLTSMANFSIYRIPLRLLLCLALLHASRANNQTSPSQPSIPPAIEFVPVVQTEYRVMTVGGDTVGRRRRLAPFQLCLLCKCCPANSGASNCSSMPCCFGIDCQLPDKPFGVCAFVPKTCNCSTCGSP